MAGYQRQSAADIVPTAVVRAAPINNEYNALRDAFVLNGGHRHDGSATEGAHVPLIADADALNKVAVDTTNNRVGVFVEVSAAAVEQVRVQDGAIVPVTDNDIDLGTASLEFKDLYIDGTANIDSLIADTADINAGTIDNTVIGATTPVAATVTNLTVNTAAVIASADINAGTIDGTVIGATATQTITGTLVTATTGFVGGLTGNVTGNTAGTHTGPVVGAVTGNVTGNVTASSGTSTFNDVTINGGLNMNAGTAATITNLSTPTNAGDAATKGYVDTADALKLNLSGGTMSGVIAMGTNKITGLGTPTLTADAATKGYVDTAVSNLIDTAPGTLDTLNELAAALGDDPNFATTIAASVATKLPLAGGTMTGAIAMGANKITGVGTPTLTADATTKGYVDTADALKLSLTGGTMSGAIAMGTNKITGVGDPTANQDAATKLYVDTADALKLSLTGGTMSGAIAMGNSKITGLATPTADADATTKLYVDGILGSATSAATSAAAAAVSASNAATSESNAATSESNAATSATNAAASYDSFDDRYLGSKTSDPSLDNDGNALLTGALYFNSTSGEMRVYSGSAWLATYLPATSYVLKAGDTMTGTLLAPSFVEDGFAVVSQKDIGTAPNEIPLNQYLGDLAYQDAANIAGNVGIGGAVTATSGVITANTTSDALRITQTGTGNAFVVEDSTSPDSSPFVIDSAGNVGIGTSSPAKQLVLAGNNSLLAENNTLRFWDTDNATQTDQQLGKIEFYSEDATAPGPSVKAYMGAFADDSSPGVYMAFATDAETGTATERMRITSAGNVGIGTSSPARPLHVNNGTAGAITGLSNNTAAVFQNDANNVFVQLISGSSSLSDFVFGTAASPSLGRIRYQPNTNSMQFWTNETERLRIDSAGNVGIGTSSPASRLHVSNAGDVADNCFNVSTPANDNMLLGANLVVDAAGTYTKPATSISGAGILFEGINNLNAHGTIKFLSAPDNNAGSATPVTAFTITSGQGIQIERTNVTSPATSDGNVYSGTYTPTQVSTNTNVSSVSFGACQYMRVGNTVTVGGQLSIAATTAATDTTARMSVPISSTFFAARNLGGTGSNISTPYAGTNMALLADSVNNGVEIRFRPSVNTTLIYNFSFTYLVN